MTEQSALDPILAVISAQGVPIDDVFAQKLGVLLTEQSLLTQGYFAQVMAEAERVTDPQVAWGLVLSTWEDLSAEETLGLVNELMGRFAEADPQPVDDDVEEDDEEDDELPDRNAGTVNSMDPTVMRAFLAAQGYDPQMLAEAPDVTIRATVQNIMDKAQGEALGAAAEAEEEPEPPRAVRVPATAVLTAARPVAKKAPAKKVAPRRAPRRPRGRVELGGDNFDPDNPFAGAGAPEVVLAAPRKTTAPRKGSGHKIPAGIDWPKDSRGRRVPPGSATEE